MIDHEIDRIAAAINRLRPDWPTASLRTLLSGPALRDRPRRDVAVAMAWIACDSKTLTPARILEAGPWWKAAAVESPEGTYRHPPRAGRDDECPRHVGEHATGCRACAADQLAGDEQRRPVRPAPRLPAEAVRQHAQAARQALHANQEDE